VPKNENHKMKIIQHKSFHFLYLIFSGDSNNCVHAPTGTAWLRVNLSACQTRRKYTLHTTGKQGISKAKSPAKSERSANTKEKYRRLVIIQSMNDQHR